MEAGIGPIVGEGEGGVNDPLIVVEDLRFEYRGRGEQPVVALDGVSLAVRESERLAILGRNGSGKSTLAKHLNGLLLPTSGRVLVAGIYTHDAARRREIRQTVGMVFQNPDNQLVATVVEEDVAFGPENLGLPSDEIRRRVDEALERVDLQHLRLRLPHLLSGGQKQRVAIAGVLAMRPRVLVLDESTAMLDPLGRAEVRAAVRRLHAEGTTVIAVTHFMEEAVEAERVVVMDGGRIVLEGSPREVFRQADRLRELRLDVPQVTRLARRIARRLPGFPDVLLDVEETAEAILARAAAPARGRPEPPRGHPEPPRCHPERSEGSHAGLQRSMRSSADVQDDRHGPRDDPGPQDDKPAADDR